MLPISASLDMAAATMCCFSLADITLTARITSLSNLTSCSLAMWSRNRVRSLFLYEMKPRQSRQQIFPFGVSSVSISLEYLELE